MTHHTTHSMERVRNRLVASGVDAALVASFIGAMVDYAATCAPGESVAVRLAVLPRPIGEPWTDDSNGDTIVAIVRDRRVATYMFRRRTQPWSTLALRVDRLVTL